jgi:pimeloyl-ACP methyl ester carboxylesterase
MNNQVSNQMSRNMTRVLYKTAVVEEVSIFYREAGDPSNPKLLLLHGFPASSHQYRNLISALSDRFHIIAPDYPGFGNSDMPSPDKFDYTFDRLSEIIEGFLKKIDFTHFGLYVQDYGAPIGFRIATKHPDWIEALIVQNGNAYEEGLKDFWIPIKAYWQNRSKENEEALRKLLTIDATKWQYTHGVRNVEAISPDNWLVDQPLLDRPGNAKIQLQLFYSYGSNPPLYPQWHEYFRKHQPPTLIAWGKNDQIFHADGAHPYKRDLKNVDFHLLDTGHFALEEDCELVAELICSFYMRRRNMQEQSEAQ